MQSDEADHNRVTFKDCIVMQTLTYLDEATAMQLHRDLIAAKERIASLEDTVRRLSEPRSIQDLGTLFEE